MTFPRNSSKYGTVQPPNVKFPLGSSVGPPDPCMTPSRERNVRIIIFLMEAILPEGTHLEFDCCSVCVNLVGSGLSIPIHLPLSHLLPQLLLDIRRQLAQRRVGRAARLAAPRAG